jgi:DNA polymerase III gamma/tau subunit
MELNKMENEKLFTVAGVSTLEGVVKARFASDLTRVKVLEKNGHTDVRLVALPNPMTKEAAMAFLRASTDYQDEAAQAALVPEVKEAKVSKTPKEPKPAKEPKVKPVKEPKAPKPTKTVKATKTSESEQTTSETEEVTEPVEGETEAERKVRIMAKNKTTIAETMAKIKQRKREEEEAELNKKKEEMQLEVDSFMSGFSEDQLPAFLRS